ncbi:MAG TPA: hypothetical protein VGN12_15875 [Pirellulales bacterium]|jgi:hypothetical protein
MTKTMIFRLCLAVSSLSLTARAADQPQYSEGAVTSVTYLQVQYGHFEEYVDWLNTLWKPTMEASKKAGLILDYKVFMAGKFDPLPPIPKSPDGPNIMLWITYKNMAALDKSVELEAVATKVIGSIEVQNKARVGRSEYRRPLGGELIRELILK